MVFLHRKFDPVAGIVQRVLDCSDVFASSCLKLELHLHHINRQITLCRRMPDVEDVAPLPCNHGKQAGEGAGLVIEQHREPHDPAAPRERLADDSEQLGAINVAAADHEHHITVRSDWKRAVQERGERHGAGALCDHPFPLEQQQNRISNLFLGGKDDSIDKLPDDRQGEETGLCHTYPVS